MRMIGIHPTQQSTFGAVKVSLGGEERFPPALLHGSAVWTH